MSGQKQPNPWPPKGGVQLPPPPPLPPRKRWLGGYEKRTEFGRITVIDWIECYGCANRKACAERAYCHIHGLSPEGYGKA